MGDIRVLHVIARMNVGGPAKEIAMLTRDPIAGLVQKIASGTCEADEMEYVDLFNEELPLVRVKGLGRRLNAFDDLRALIDLRRLFKEFRPDIVHTHTAKAGVLGRIAVLLSGCDTRVVHTFHGHLLYGYYGRQGTKLIVVLERLLARKTDMLIAVGPTVMTDLLAVQIGKQEKFRVIYSGVGGQTYPDPQLARRCFGIRDGIRVVSFVGRLSAIKRPGKFLDVVSQVAKALPETKFLIAGEGEFSDEIHARIKRENLPVTMLGWEPDITKVMAASDVLVVTSANEGIPLTVIEAALSSVPTVAVNVGSISDAIESGVNGVLCSENPAHVAAEVVSLLKDGNRRSEMGRTARSFAESRHSSRMYIQAHQRLYTSLLEK